MVYEIVTELLITVFDVSPETVGSTASLEDLGLDSLAQVELADRLAEHFDIQIPETALRGPTTLADIVHTVEQRQGTWS
ncbi:acyl carrier protein [Streptomyces clavuligerus]|uniref:Probable acyl carrier protein n=1 Tax=Streptomyces clavuligerus TaxID=1901 RepID=B5H3N2_STRCL|nr:acyl carrier protein [Streptomyces clavuligerus]EDY53178.1 hypothetical protein SSCG_06215 [Streptomyces clavuligerus]EFG04054.1 Probable acyl carrier protein [Streptomyces clavuligerus]MBY6307457.1 acyl carrier protein [Streptomyces clavuligerus]QCS09983.1 acyl carrier protein [Streptomyces clavuligerus]QPJ97974.1 acyl carrier protein [Streptomyces clavuligerus]